MTLRAQIAAATGIIVLLVVAVAGALIALSMDRRDRAEVDDQLRARAERVFADLDKLRSDGDGRNQPGDDSYGGLLEGNESLVRLLNDTEVVAQRGAIPDESLASPTGDGFSTVSIDGTDWRSYVVSATGGTTLQVLQSLEPVSDRRASNTRLILLVTLLAAATSLGAGWLVGNRVLKPLQDLTSGAVSIAADPDPGHRLPELASPSEVAALSSTLNGMLDRLGASAETTRRFAADVGHELRGPLTASTTYLETLLSSSDLPPQARGALEAVHAQQQRMAAVLSALQVLARGDARAMPAPDELEPGLLVEEVVRLVRNHHPTVNFTFTDDSAGAVVLGWTDGLRIAVENLLTNGAIHGRPGGNVDVQVSPHGDGLTIAVADDGPGIPADQRDHVRHRFTRGNGVLTPGTGLGLALVQQQADLHGGTLDLSASDHGGLLARLHLPRRPPAIRSGA